MKSCHTVLVHFVCVCIFLNVQYTSFPIVDTGTCFLFILSKGCEQINKNLVTFNFTFIPKFQLRIQYHIIIAEQYWMPLCNLKWETITINRSFLFIYDNHHVRTLLLWMDSKIYNYCSMCSRLSLYCRRGGGARVATLKFPEVLSQH